MTKFEAVGVPRRARYSSVTSPFVRCSHRSTRSPWGSTSTRLYSKEPNGRWFSDASMRNDPPCGVTDRSWSATHAVLPSSTEVVANSFGAAHHHEEGEHTR